MGKKLVIKSLRFDDEQANWIARASMDLDTTFGDLVIKALVFAIPNFLSNKEILDISTWEKFLIRDRISRLTEDLKESQ